MDSRPAFWHAPLMTQTNLSRLSALLWILAFFCGFGLVQPELERLAAVLLTVASLSLLVANGGRLPDRAIAAPRPALYILLLWLIAVLSCAWSVAPYVSLTHLGIYTMLPVTILGVLFAEPEPRSEWLRVVAWGAGLVVTAMAIWALVQVFFFPGLLVNGQVRYPFQNPNAFAAMLALVFFSGFGLVLKQDQPRRRLPILIGLFFILSAFAAIAGKTSALIMTAGLLAFALFGGGGVLRLRWKSLFALAASVLVMAIAIACRPNQINIVHQMAAAVGDRFPTLQNRFDIWRGAWALIRRHPVLGTGYHTFFLTYPSVRLASEIHSSGMMVHNDPLQFWVEMGIAAPILFYLLVRHVLWRCIRYWRTTADAPEQRAWAFALFLGCAGFILHAHVDFLLYTVPTMMLFGLAVPVLLLNTGADPLVRPLDFAASWPKGCVEWALLLPLLAVLAVFTPLVVSEYEVNRATALINAGEIQGFAAAINRANRVGFGMNARPYLMAATVPLSILQNHPPETQQHDLVVKIDRLLARALTANPKLAAAWFDRGEMIRAATPAALPRDMPSAEYCYRTALAIDPLNLPSRLALADILAAHGDRRAAYDLLRSGLNWPYQTEDTDAFYRRVETMARDFSDASTLSAVDNARKAQAARITDSQRKIMRLRAVQSQAMQLLLH